MDIINIPLKEDISCQLCNSIGNFIINNNIEYCLDACVYCTLRNNCVWGNYTDGSARYTNGILEENIGPISNNEIVHLYLKNGLILRKTFDDILNSYTISLPTNYYLPPPPIHIRNEIILYSNNNNRIINVEDVLNIFNNLFNDKRYSEEDIFGFELKKYNLDYNLYLNIVNNIDWNYHYPSLTTRNLLDTIN